MSRYLANYRHGAQFHTGGVQKPGGKPLPFPIEPDNDNVPRRPIGKPANDNYPRKPSGAPANDNRPGGRSSRRGSGVRRFGEYLKRRSPLIGIVAGGVALYQWSQGTGEDPEHFAGPISPPGFTRYRVNCVQGVPGTPRNLFYGGPAMTNGFACQGLPAFFIGPGYTQSPSFITAVSTPTNNPFVGWVVTENINSGEVTDTWNRNAGGANPKTDPWGKPGTWRWPVAFPLPDPVPLPWIYPSIDPGALPISVPVPNPRPLPLNVPRPNNPPDPNRRPNIQPRRRVRPQRQVRVRPVQTAQRQVVTPRLATQPGPVRYEPTRLPDNKWILSPHPASWFAWAINAITETRDLIRAIHDALPDQYKRHKIGPINELQALWEHGEHIDVRKAIRNVIAEGIDDKVYGVVGEVNAQTNRNLGRARGPATGPLEDHHISSDLPSPGEMIANKIVYGDPFYEEK